MKTKLDDYLKDHPEQKPCQVARLFKISQRTVREHRHTLGLKPHKAGFPLIERELSDKEVAEMKKEEIEGNKKAHDDKRAVRHFIQENARLQSIVDSMRVAKASREHLAIAKGKPGQDDATAVVLASDWHVEENVDPSATNGLNHFNLAIAEKRVAMFWQSVARLVRAKQKSMKIETLVIGILGDMFSGWIHDELMAGNEIGPCPAMVKVHGWIRDGLRFLVEQKLVKKITCVCHSGNHARISKKVMVSQENAASLEFAMYHFLASEFPEIEWIIPDGYHSYIDIHGFVIRMSHGHAVKYSGGVGGIHISANKAVNQWNKARKADLDCWGHHHTFKYGGNFICNGSLIGFGPYSLWIKADFERPQQAFFLVHHVRRQVTDLCPIWLT